MKVREFMPAQRIVNLFGAIAYSILLLVYTVVVAITIQWMMNNEYIIVTTGDETEVTQTEIVDDRDSTTMSLLAKIVTYTVTGVMTLVVLFVTITLPYWLGRMGSYVLKRVIRLCKWQVTPLSLFFGKAIACAGIIAPLLSFVAQDITSLLSMLVAIILAGLSFILFLIQHYLAKMTGLQAADIW